MFIHEKVKCTRRLLLYIIYILLILTFLTYFNLYAVSNNSNTYKVITEGKSAYIDQQDYSEQRTNVTNLQSQYDAYVYADNYTVNNDICKILFPPSIIFYFHHKTGTVLARKIRDIILDFCGIIYSKYIRRLYHYYILWMDFRETHRFSDITETIGIHFTRDPLLTIVSGFKYHISCREKWASSDLNIDQLHFASIFYDESRNIDEIRRKYMDITWTFDINKEEPIWRYRLNQKEWDALYSYHHIDRNVNKLKWGSIRVMTLYYLNDIVNGMSLKKYGDFYGFNLDYDDVWIHSRFNIFRGNKENKQKHFSTFRSINVWYSKMFNYDETMKYGLYFEMMRYLFVIYPEIYDVHFNKISNTKNELKMEIWNMDFEQNANIILDALHLVDDEENRRKLVSNGVMDINITNVRESLLYNMTKQDASQIKVEDDSGHKDIGSRRKKDVKRWMENKDMRNNNVRKYKEQAFVSQMDHRRMSLIEIDSDHIHRGRNDTKYIDALLTLDVHICLLLKHITNLIEFDWQYTTYC